MTLLTSSQWGEFLLHHPEAHLLQQPEWGELKRAFGWQSAWVQSGVAGAQVLFRQLPLGFTMGYIPKGPVGSDWQALWPEVDRLCREKRAIFLKVEPDLWEGVSFDAGQFLPGFLPARPIQPRRTIVISLEGSEEDWLMRMKQKTRYNIRLAEKKDVIIRFSSDMHIFQQLMDVTGERDDFGVHSLAYYRKTYDLFHPSGMCELLVAYYNDKPLAGLMVFARGKRAWYMYGASNNEERNRMPAYLLQWEAMRWAAGKGCTEYDLWGVPDCSEEELEAGFTQSDSGLWGVYRFKRGFGGQVLRSVGGYDRVYRPLLYRAIQMVLRRRGQEG